MLVPVGDELIKVVRIGGDPHSTDGGVRFAEIFLSGVRFAPLLTNPQIPTLLKSRVWEPSNHLYYPNTFRASAQTLLLCSNSNYVQPPPRKRLSARVNYASILPVAIWMEILSFTHRNCEYYAYTNKIYLDRFIHSHH